MKILALSLLFLIGCISEATETPFSLPAHFSGNGTLYENGQMKFSGNVSFDVLQLNDVCYLIQHGGLNTANDTSHILAYSVNSKNNTFVYGGYPIPIWGSDTIFFDKEKKTLTQKIGGGQNYYIAIAHR